jgi:glucose-1-phosphate cytidylyltransferase
MKAVILAGGLGTRLSEETHLRPKPMVEIGNRPMIWHIMKTYSYHGVNDFIVCCGYKGYVIKEYFSNYYLHMSDVTIDLINNDLTVHHERAEPWKITLVDTGETTMTGGRLKRVENYLKGEHSFCLTYGDGIGDINISESIKFHNKHRKLATITATLPPGRFGALETDGDQVINFKEKPRGDGALINAGFFVLNSQVLNYIENDLTIWEGEPLQKLAADSELMLFRHDGFWHPVDTLRDKQALEKMWEENIAPWKIW